MSFRAGTAWGFEVGSETPNWRTSAACRDADPEAMWPLPADDQGIAYARSVCAHCPKQTRIKCIEDGIEAQEWDSVRGGFTGPERRSRHALGHLPESYPPPGPRAKRWCNRCWEPFVLDPDHPYRKICPSCDLRRARAVSHAS